MSRIFNLISIPFGWNARGTVILDHYRSIDMLDFQTLGFSFTYSPNKPQIFYDTGLDSFFIRPPASSRGHCIINDLRNYNYKVWPIDLYTIKPGNVIVVKSVDRFTAMDVTSLRHTSYMIVELFADTVQLRTKYIYSKPYSKEVSR